MNINKIIGFVLLAIGLFVIAGSLFFSWQIFTGVNPAPELFSLPQTSGADSIPLVGSFEDLGQKLPDLLGE